MTRIFRGYFGSKFYIPSEYDIFISFAPIGNSENSIWNDDATSGKFSFRAELRNTVEGQDADDPLCTVMEEATELPAIPEECLVPEEEEVVEEPTEEIEEGEEGEAGEESESESASPEVIEVPVEVIVEVYRDPVLTNWDGEEVEKGKW